MQEWKKRRTVASLSLLQIYGRIKNNNGTFTATELKLSTVGFVLWNVFYIKPANEFGLKRTNHELSRFPVRSYYKQKSISCPSMPGQDTDNKS